MPKRESKTAYVNKCLRDLTRAKMVKTDSDASLIRTIVEGAWIRGGLEELEAQLTKIEEMRDAR